MIHLRMNFLVDAPYFLHILISSNRIYDSSFEKTNLIRYGWLCMDNVRRSHICSQPSNGSWSRRVMIALYIVSRRSRDISVYSLIMSSSVVTHNPVSEKRLLYHDSPISKCCIRDSIALRLHITFIWLCGYRFEWSTRRLYHICHISCSYRYDLVSDKQHLTSLIVCLTILSYYHRWMIRWHKYIHGRS